jgi:diguanylate cyclase (GGDEF)-like protein
MVMHPRQALLAATVIAATIVPAASANAAADTTPGDVPATVAGLATDAANWLAQERELLEIVGEPSGADTALAREQLRTVDVQGNAILDQFDRLDVSVSPSVRAALALLPAPEGERLGTTERALVPQPVVYGSAIADLERIAATPDAVVPHEPGDGQPSLGLLLVAGGALVALAFAARTGSARREDDELAVMAWSDGLTGVANRRRLERDLTLGGNPELGPTSVLMVDVDHFKSVNDTYGHQTGDDVLRRMGAMIAAQVREQDVVYRYGGEEFCVLLIGATTDDASAIGERVVRGAHAITLPDGDHVTVSVGIAAGDPGTVVDTLDAADRALFEAKLQGRDRALTAEQLQPA